VINEGYTRIYILIQDLLVETCLWLVVSVELQLSLVPFGVSSKMSFDTIAGISVLTLAIWVSYFGSDFSLLQGRALAERVHFRLPSTSFEEEGTIRRLFGDQDGNLERPRFRVINPYPTSDLIVAY
jgi:hypothetical protein